ncbi:hypothetical protein DFH09DRAFT_1115363 [Mycena vulgaris]|nr:hypothetical protein DFH09DRAFT_1115363 [Mycena vulgaris]
MPARCCTQQYHPAPLNAMPHQVHCGVGFLPRQHPRPNTPDGAPLNAATHQISMGAWIIVGHNIPDRRLSILRFTFGQFSGRGDIAATEVPLSRKECPFDQMLHARFVPLFDPASVSWPVLLHLCVIETIRGGVTPNQAPTYLGTQVKLNSPFSLSLSLRSKDVSQRSFERTSLPGAQPGTRRVDGPRSATCRWGSLAMGGWWT